MAMEGRHNDKNLDKILVIDVEATCWEDRKPPDQSHEIIEIGIVTVDVTRLQRESKRSIIIKPQKSVVSAFCTQLTTLTQADVDHGTSLKEACAILRDEYQARDRVWASWGDYDREALMREWSQKGVDYPLGFHLNAKTLYALAIGVTRERGMSNALRRLNLPLEGTHHRGADDAWNIAGILCHVLGKAREVTTAPAS